MQKKYGCLLIHGLGGGIHEVEPLVAPLEAKGFEVACPVLEGHSGPVPRLHNIQFREWILSAERALLKLVQSCEKIYIVGFAMGGLIAIELAMRYKISAIVFVNTPVYNRYLLANMVSGRTKRESYISGRNFSSPVPLPVSVIKVFRQLLNKVKPMIAQLKMPVMIAQSDDDQAARRHSASYLMSHTHSVVKQPSYYETGGHQLLTGEQGERVVKDIVEFFNTLEKINH